MGTSVKDLQARPFSSRSMEEKREIIKNGKPKPDSMGFGYFEREEFLTACEQSQTFFCWTCLLFVSDGCSVWNTVGFADKKMLMSSFELHKSTEGHIGGLFEYQLFINKNTGPPVVKSNSADAPGNKRILKRIIDVVCHMTNADSPVRRGIDVFDDEILLKNFFEYLDLLKYYDFNNVSEDVTRIVKDSPTVLMHTVRALSEMITAGIKREVQSSIYVSLIFSEHLDADLISKMSCVMRFVKDGKVRERFVGFINFIGDKSDSALLSHCVSEILVKFDVEAKFISLSCDGAVITSSSQLNGFMSDLRLKYSDYIFVPCYRHELDSVLEQGLSANFQECHTFFQQIRAMNEFVKSCPKLTLELHEIMRDEILNFKDLQFSDSHFLRIVRMHRPKFVLYFNVIVSKFAEYRADDVACAYGFISVLKDPHTVFFLVMFHALYSKTAVFSEALGGPFPEYVFDKGVFDDLVRELKIMALSGFERVWHQVRLEKECLPMANPEESANRFSKIFDLAMRHVIDIVENRLNSLEKLNFFQVLNNSEPHKKFVLADEHSQNLLSVCGDAFDLTLLKYELSVINSNREMLAVNSIYELLETMERSKLQSTFKNVYYLANFILTTPIKPPVLSGEPSKFEAIHAWSVTAKKEIFTDDWSLLAVEKEVLNKLKSEDDFFDNFISEFRKLNASFQVI